MDLFRQFELLHLLRQILRKGGSADAERRDCDQLKFHNASLSCSPEPGGV